MKIRNDSSLFKSEWLIWFPHLLVVCWLIYLGITIWQHAHHSVQPPLYDPLSYMLKAMNFWQAVEHGKFINPLNLVPTSRPPGTILMSYPFGFTPDFRGFHFRSVFFPIICIIAAVYIVAGTTKARSGRWWMAAIVLLFSSLPMLYQFDKVDGRYSPVSWGMVDNFQAGIAALAAAALLRSIMARSQTWLLLSASLAALTLLIKPSGLMVMALLALIWLIVITMEWRWSLGIKSTLSSLRVYAVKGISSILIVYISVIVLCVLSGYLSRSNVASGKQAVATLRQMSHISLQNALLFFHHSSGESLLLWVIGVGVLFMYRFRVLKESNDIMSVRVLGVLVGSLFVWILGAWYWLVVQAGFTQIRYFYPFMLMGAVCMIPAALAIWPHANRLIRIILMVICFLPAVNIAGLMSMGDNPSIFWQKMAGVSVSVGRDREEIHQAYTFLAELRKGKQYVQIYSFSNGLLPQIFENVGTYERIVRPSQPSFHSTIPEDWVRGFAVRVDELLDSDYILIRKHENHDASSFLAAKRFDSYGFERTGFEVWLSTLKEQSGVETVSDGRVLRLLRIVDKAALSRAIDLFVAAHVWRPEFTMTNLGIM